MSELIVVVIFWRSTDNVCKQARLST